MLPKNIRQTYFQRRLKSLVPKYTENPCRHTEIREALKGRFSQRLARGQQYALDAYLPRSLQSVSPIRAVSVREWLKSQHQALPAGFFSCAGTALSPSTPKRVASRICAISELSKSSGPVSTGAGLRTGSQQHGQCRSFELSIRVKIIRVYGACIGIMEKKMETAIL